MKHQDYHHFNETINQGMPIVMFDRVVNEINCDKVIVDDLKGSRIAVEKLISNACKNIALITTKDYVSVGRLRTQGYLEALEAHKMIAESGLILKVNDDLVTDDHIEVLEEEVELLFKSNPKIDAVFAVNELYAVTAMKVARSLGLSVPDDVQVIGFSDGVLSKHATPTLTTVSQHAQIMGEKAAELLIQRLENESDDEEEIEQYQTLVVDTELIERDSTK